MAVRKHASPAWVRQVMTAIWRSVTNARAKNDWSKIEHAVPQYEFECIITPHHAKATNLGSWLWPRRRPRIRLQGQARRRIEHERVRVQPSCAGIRAGSLTLAAIWPKLSRSRK